MSIRSGVVIALLLLSLSTPTVAQDWRQYQTDERNTGSLGDAVPIEPGQGISVTRGVSSSVVHANDSIYLIDGAGVLERRSSRDGALIWRFDDALSATKSPIVANDTVYLSGRDGTVYALDSNGSVAWERSLAGGSHSAPALDGEVLYAAHGRNISALDPTTGERRWTTAIGRGTTGPVTVADRVYVTALNEELEGSLIALDPDSGDIAWRFSRPEVVTIPAVVDNAVYVADQAGTVHALDASDGASRWRRSLGRTNVSYPSVSDDSLYIGTGNGSLYALSLSDGSTRWRYDGEGRFFGTPALLNGQVYAMNRGGGVVAVAGDTGEALWNGSVSERTLGSPTVAGGAVFLPAESGFYVLNASRNVAASSDDRSPDDAGTEDSSPRPSPAPSPAVLVGASLVLIATLVSIQLLLSEREQG